MKKILSLVLASWLLLTSCTVSYSPNTTPATESTTNSVDLQSVTPPAPSPVIEAQETTPSVSDSTTSTSDTNSLSNDNSYINIDGNEVHSPAYSETVPSGASAICGDGTYSFSQHRSGTCSGHGGVAEWL